MVREISRQIPPAYRDAGELRTGDDLTDRRGHPLRIAGGTNGEVGSERRVLKDGNEGDRHSPGAGADRTGWQIIDHADHGIPVILDTA